MGSPKMTGDKRRQKPLGMMFGSVLGLRGSEGKNGLGWNIARRKEFLETMSFQGRLFFGYFVAVDNQFFVVREPGSDLGDRFCEVKINGGAE